MAEPLRDRFFGQTLDEWIEKLPGELPVDAVGLWQIVRFARDGFGLSGKELVQCVRRCLFALFARGAQPVTGSLDNVYIWTLVPYGETREEMANNIVNEWLASGRDPDLGDVWFALPHIYNEKKHPDSPVKGPSMLS
jgi:hypothetical protein